MVLKKLKQFQEKTREAYEEGQRESMESWKQTVMDLHEKSRFLFYYEDCELETGDGRALSIKGELVKEEVPENRHIYCYSGEAVLLGEGFMEGDPVTKEEKRRGFLRPRKNEFVLKLTVLGGEDTTEMEERELRRRLRTFFQDVSLLSDCASS